MKTLVVEDDHSMRQLFAAVLRARGHEVTACDNAGAALEAYRREAHPLVLLDWMLADADGLELCRQMRREPCNEASVILVVTARRDAEDLKAVLAAGADDYLSKPIDPNLLLVRLTIAEQNVRHRQERREAQGQLRDTLSELERSHGDLLSILNLLRVGTAMTDDQGRITFLSQLAGRFLCSAPGDLIGKPWEEAFPFDPQNSAELKAMIGRPVASRHNVAVHVESPRGGRYWMEVEVQDDPRDAKRKIFLLYDVSEVYDLRRQLASRAQFHDLVGRSEPMRQLYQQIQDVAVVDATVLIEGETGTGKELVARAIHAAGPRKDKPFIAVNCAGLTDSLLASQLFGHRRGAFTGAVQDQVGLFEAARGGTLFLDEIGDVPMSVQTALLRVLQEKEITRVGESVPRKIDVRVIVATHRNLSLEVAEGRFRSDLLYRIRVARLNLAPLRKRTGDISLLVATFLKQLTASSGNRVEAVSDEAMNRLLEYPWPGNVRELRSAIEYAVIHCKSPVIKLEDLPIELTTRIDLVPERTSRMEPVEEQALDLEGALKRARGNRAAAARLLGISRATLYRHLARLESQNQS